MNVDGRLSPKRKATLFAVLNVATLAFMGRDGKSGPGPANFTGRKERAAQ